MNIAAQILDYFGPNGERWNPRGYAKYDDRNNPISHCVIGGLDFVLGVGTTKSHSLDRGPAGQRFLQTFRSVVREQFPDFTKRVGGLSVADFNDNSPWEDVKLVLEKTSVRLDEEVT